MWDLAFNFVARLGGDYFIDAVPLIAFDGVPLVTANRRAPDGLIGVDLDVYDDGALVAKVQHGKITRPGPIARYLGNPSPYNIEICGGIYRVIDERSNLVLCEVRRLPPRDANGARAEVAVSTNFYLPTGHLLQATPTEWRIQGIRGSCNIWNGGGKLAGVAIGSGSGCLGLKPVGIPAPFDVLQAKRDLDREIRMAATGDRLADVQGGKCRIPGDYKSSGCPHPTVLHVLEGDEFPACAQCGTNVVWTIEIQPI